MRTWLMPILVACAVATTGCAAAVGAGAAGGAYEYQNKQAQNELDREFKAGKISRQEYLRRQQEISDKSLVY